MVPSSVARRLTTLTTVRSPGRSPAVLRYSTRTGSLTDQQSRRSIRPYPLFQVVT